MLPAGEAQKTRSMTFRGTAGGIAIGCDGCHRFLLIDGAIGPHRSFRNFDQSAWDMYPDGSICLDPGPHAVCFPNSEEAKRVALVHGFKETADGKLWCPVCTGPKNGGNHSADSLTGGNS